MTDLRRRLVDEGGMADLMDGVRAASWRTRNAQAVDNAVDDHAPTCPRCDDLLPHGARYCASCGCKVVT